MKRFVILFFLLPLFSFSQPFSIATSAPNQIKSGSFFVLTITLNKSDYTGFGILQINYPSAFRYNNILVRNVSKKIIDTSQRLIKLYWSTMPVSDKINVSLYFNTKKFSKDFSVKYWFEYQADNIRGFIRGQAVNYKIDRGIAIKISTVQNFSSVDTSIVEIQNFFDE